VFAELAEVYFCETIQDVGLYPDDGVFLKTLKPEDSYGIIEFKKENFSFKLTEENIIFNKESDNHFKGSEVPITDFYSNASTFYASNKYQIISFVNGHFFYTLNVGAAGTKIIYAKCESF